MFNDRGTGGGPPCEQLTVHEQKVLGTMGGMKRVVGFSSIIDPMKVSSDTFHKMFISIII